MWKINSREFGSSLGFLIVRDKSIWFYLRRIGLNVLLLWRFFLRRNLCNFSILFVILVFLQRRVLNMGFWNIFFDTIFRFFCLKCLHLSLKFCLLSAAGSRIFRLIFMRYFNIILLGYFLNFNVLFPFGFRAVVYD